MQVLVQVDLPSCLIKLLVQVLIYKFCPARLLNLLTKQFFFFFFFFLKGNELSLNRKRVTWLMNLQSRTERAANQHLQ